jgi:hypothetical protein
MSVMSSMHRLTLLLLCYLLCNYWKFHLYILIYHVIIGTLDTDLDLNEFTLDE